MGAIRSTEQGATRRTTANGGDLTREELESAERGFLQLLRRKRFSPAFLDRHAADLLAKARLELSEHLAGGAEVRNPAGWIVHCAWRRTQNLLEQEGRTPRVLSIDNGHPIARESVTPEDRALESDRYRRLQSAIERLPEEERKVIALAYFEGMSVREVGRALKWDKCKADRRHHAALERLRKLLQVEDIDSLAVELGILAWTSVTVPHPRPRPLAFLDVAGHHAIALLGRTQDLARRLLGGGAAEPGMGPALGGAARAAGACGAAAVACLATGVIGPGVGAVNDLAEHHRRPPVEHHAPAPAPTEPASAPVAAPATSASAATNEAATRASKSASHKRNRETSSAASSAPTASAKQVAQEFDPFSGGGGEATSEASSGSSGSASSSSSMESSGTSSSSSSAPQASGKQVESEFGF